MRYLYLLIALLSFLLAPACPSTAEERPNPSVKLTITPEVQFAGRGGATVTVRVTIPQDARNRLIRVEIDGGIYRAWEQDHVGSGASYGLQWAIKGLPAGEYVGAVGLAWVDEAGKWRQSVSRAEFLIR